MSPLRRARARSSWLCNHSALAMFAVLTLGTATAGAAATAQARAVTRSSGEHAVQLSTAMRRQLGIGGAALSERQLCATAPAPGQATCLAEVLTLSSSGRALHPNHVSATRPSVAKRHVTSLLDPLATTTSEPASQTQPGNGTAAFLQQAYDTTWLSANNGSGDTVAIVDAYSDPTAASDLAIFRAQNGLSSCTIASGCLTVVNQSGQTQSQASSWPATNTSWQGEQSLDLDAVSALCPNCKILLVEANSSSDLDTAEKTAEAWSGVKQVSDSWDAAGTEATGLLSAAGISVLAATGDDGFEPRSGNWPANDPTVTAVGGTTLAIGSASTPRGFTETAWAGSGSACDTAVSQPSWQSGEPCDGRSIADVSADADPASGLLVYDSGYGGWGLYGGTSLATPLTAAFEAITQGSGYDFTTPQWSYTNSVLLNDISSGSNDTNSSLDTGGVCAANLLYICNAGPGYDGPTGNGSISGQIATGGPGVGGPDATLSTGGTGYLTGVSSSTITLDAGLYPNGLATNYWWEYGTSTSFGSSSAVASVPAARGAVAVTGTLSGLSGSTTYYYRLVASNADGATYGYTYASMTSATIATDGGSGSTDGGTGSTSGGTGSTSGTGSTGGGTGSSSGGTGSTGGTGGAKQTAPVSISAPTISGRAIVGQKLTAGLGVWHNSLSAVTYQWQRSSGTSWVNLTPASATAGSYKVTAASVGARLRLLITATNAGGSTQAVSAATAIVAAAKSTAPKAGSAAARAAAKARAAKAKAAKAKAAKAKAAKAAAAARRGAAGKAAATSRR